MLLFRGTDLLKIYKFFRHSSQNKYEFKIKTLFLTTVIFSILYLFLDDLDFSGVNIVQEKIKDELIEKTVEKEIDENVPEAFRNQGSELLPDKSSDLQIEIATEEVKDEVKKEDLQAENIEPSLIMKFFNRLYFSINTGCLLGYGDIYPVSSIAKIMAMIQAMITILLILY